MAQLTPVMDRIDSVLKGGSKDSKGSTRVAQSKTSQLQRRGEKEAKKRSLEVKKEAQTSERRRLESLVDKRV